MMQHQNTAALAVIPKHALSNATSAIKHGPSVLENVIQVHT